MLLKIRCSAAASRRASPDVDLRSRAVANILAMALLFMAALPCVAASRAPQDKKKDKKEQDSGALASPTPVGDNQAIDYAVSQMLGAWQVGDINLLHKYSADDIVVISGSWEPPLIGWETYLHAYQAQRATGAAGRLDRMNTYTKLLGDTAWVTYQWQYTGQSDGNTFQAFGHTTLVMQKRAGNWVVVLNHTSDVPNVPQPQTPGSNGAKH